MPGYRYTLCLRAYWDMEKVIRNGFINVTQKITNKLHIFIINNNYYYDYSEAILGYPVASEPWLILVGGIPTLSFLVPRG